MRTRSSLSALVALLATAGAAVAQVDVTPDVVYGHKDGMALTYDVLRPSGTANGAAVAYMVSGGWVSSWSPPESVAQRGLIAELLGRGFTVYLVRHGSSPRFKVPDAIADARLAVAHIRDHAAERGVDPRRIGLTGASAGGHLSLSIGLRAEGRIVAAVGAADGADGAASRDGASDAPAARPNQVAAVVAYFPPVDLRGWARPNERFPALEFDPGLEIDSSPLLFATTDDPPTLLLHGDEDGLVPFSHSERMHEALVQAGVTTDFVLFPGQGHGFRGEDAVRATKLTADWFERHLVESPGR
jgi:acetyl esterase/lipase